MADVPARPEHRPPIAHLEVLAAIAALREQLLDLAAKVAGLITWQEGQAREDFERRSREQREKLREEWEAEQAAKEASAREQRRQVQALEEKTAREARLRLIERFYLLVSAVAALAAWDLLSSWEHGTIASLQSIVAVVILILVVLLIALGGRP